MTRSVHIRQADRAVAVGDGQTILAAALNAGVVYPHGCRSGRCGACKSRLLAGEVYMLAHTRFALTAEERAYGLILACCAQPLTDTEVAWLGEEEIIAHPVRIVEAKVVALDDATHDIKRVRLRIAGEPLAFTAGQYVQVSVAGAPTRDYSMANVPGEDELEFHIRRIPGGKASERIAARLAVGDAVMLRGPFGSASLREGHSAPILAVAGDLRDLGGWKAYLTGPPAMIDVVGPLLQARGLASEDLHADIFFTSEPPPQDERRQTSGETAS